MSDTPTTTVDDMAEALSKQMYAFNAERSKLLETRASINDRLKYLNVEIDKAERMTKALVPRHRRSPSSRNGD